LALACLSASLTLQSEYNELIALHQRVWTNGGIHSAAQFLPWHRWYLNQLEDVLRKVVPGITIPYVKHPFHPNFLDFPFLFCSRTLSDRVIALCWGAFAAI
jgi:hypothetical protein